MNFRISLILALVAALMQPAVFLQSLLPAKYQIESLCDTITLSLANHQVISDHHHSASISKHQVEIPEQSNNTQQHMHDGAHHCPFCTVYANLFPPPKIEIKEIFERLRLRLLFFKDLINYTHLQRFDLFLLPQSRAPPLPI